MADIMEGCGSDEQILTNATRWVARATRWQKMTRDGAREDRDGRFGPLDDAREQLDGEIG